jgi:hypothetical protein
MCPNPGRNPESPAGASEPQKPSNPTGCPKTGQDASFRSFRSGESGKTGSPFQERRMPSARSHPAEGAGKLITFSRAEAHI